ncbi:MAG TPA: type II secretion system protein [Phycisphaerae bacterium]|nr:type II secretion system protein [Phycisphaerae bacterium]HRY70462.1 type II secretion system protein [Phycisphaerae bacterium]HSA27696.1 type II secretion system protein [Phycisphaerae bacterium]
MNPSVPRTTVSHAARNLRFPTRAGFTLIEVLVVVAIIALLITVLLPSLSRARRQARVVTCSSGISQIVKGLMVYAAESKGKYPTRGANYPNQVQYNRTAQPDIRRFLYLKAANKHAAILWCPLIKSTYYFQPANSTENLPDEEDRSLWSKVFFVADVSRGYGGNPSYMMGYNLFAGMRAGDYSGPYFWAESGNRSRDHEPQDAGYSQDVIVADVNESWPAEGWSTPLKPYRSFHSENPEATPYQLLDVPATRFMDSNAGFGDGHVETRRKIKNYVGRGGYGSQATGAYSY